MRFTSRIALGFTAAALAAAIAPAAAGATTTATTTSATAASQGAWGPYFSSDHQSRTQGRVSVDTQRYRHWYWKTDFVRDRVCFKDHKGDRHCKWVVKKVRKKVWEWRKREFFTVHSTLVNHKSWGKSKCAWETFRIVDKNGSTSFKTFSNCGRSPRHFSFSGTDAVRISVNVSRGDRFHSTGQNSGWKPVHHAGV